MPRSIPVPKAVVEHNATELWQQHCWIVERWARRWRQEIGKEYEPEVWDACVDAFLRTIETWNPTKAAFNTHLTMKLYRRMNNWAKRRDLLAARLPMMFLEELPDLPTRDTNLTLGIVELGENARAVVDLILQVPGGFTGIYRPLRHLRKVLRNYGWTDEQITTSFTEVREMLRAL